MILKFILSSVLFTLTLGQAQVMAQSVEPSDKSEEGRPKQTEKILLKEPPKKVKIPKKSKPAVKEDEPQASPEGQPGSLPTDVD